jgi:hypothetical protein
MSINTLNFGSKVVFLSGLPLTLPVIASDPGSAGAGDMYYNSTSNTVRYYNGSAWQDIGGGGGGGGANTGLSNLTSTAINTSLIPASDGSIGLGSQSLGFADAFSESWNVTDGVGNISAVLQTGLAAPDGSSTVAQLTSNYDPANTSAAGAFAVFTGNDAVNNTGNLLLETGNATGATNNSGDIHLTTGTTVGGTKGNLVIAVGQTNFSDGSLVAVQEIMSGGGLQILDSGGNTSVNIEGRTLMYNTGTELSWGSAGVNIFNTLTMNGQYISGLHDPFAAQDAATKHYVDMIGTRPFVTLKDDTAVILPTGSAYTADGQPVVNGNRVLFTNLVTGNNEVYVVGGVGTSLTWTLATDGQNGDGTPAAGDILLVLDGTANGQKLFDYTGAAWNNISSSGGGSGANTSLSNLTTTSINTDLLPSSAIGESIGSSALPWSTVWTSLINLSGGPGTVEAQIEGGGSSPSGAALQLSMYGIYQNSAAPGNAGLWAGGDGTADANQGGSLYLETGNKINGTGNAGDINLRTGTSIGGNSGNINLMVGPAIGPGVGSININANILPVSAFGSSIGSLALPMGLMVSDAFQVSGGASDPGNAQFYAGGTSGASGQQMAASLSGSYDSVYASALGIGFGSNPDNAADAINTLGVYIESGNQSNAGGTGNSGLINIQTGSTSGTGNTGGINIQTGAPLNGGTRGAITIVGNGTIVDNNGDLSIDWGIRTLNDSAGVLAIDYDVTRGLYSTTGVAVAGWGDVGLLQFNMLTHPIVNLADPTNPQDAATKNYVDNSAASFPAVTLTDASSTNVYTNQVTKSRIIAYEVTRSGETQTGMIMIATDGASVVSITDTNVNTAALGVTFTATSTGGTTTLIATTTATGTGAVMSYKYMFDNA